MSPKAAGFTLIEFLVALLLTSVVLIGAAGAFASHTRTHGQQDLAVSMEENLRMSMDILTDTLRTAGYGVPTTNLASWIPWVAGFTSNPKISTTNPVSVAVAGCTQQPIATLSAGAIIGATTLSVSSSVVGSSPSSLLDTFAKSLILLDGSENARVTAVNGSSITIDTDPALAANQGLLRAYPAGAPICRVDVLTFRVYTDETTGVPWLGLDANQGGGSQPVAEGISSVTIAAVAAKQYQATLTARSHSLDRVTRAYLTRALQSNVTLKN